LDFYFSQLSQVYVSKISDVVVDTKLSDSDKSKTIQLLISNAINAAKISTEASPNNVNNWANRALVYQNLIGTVPGADDWAITSNEQAALLDPQNPYYLTQKGIDLMAKANLLSKDKVDEKNKNWALAKTQFDNAIKLKADYSPALFQLAMLYQAEGKTDQVMPALLQTQVYAPDDIGLAFQIGVLYYQNQNYLKAQAELEKAVSLNANYSNALYYLALTYYKQGNTAGAFDQMSKVLTLNPDNEQVKKTLSNLQNNKDPLDGIIKQNPPEVPVQENSPAATKK
jgi:tetratricopeptide (TPR) repeat protein